MLHVIAVASTLVGYETAKVLAMGGAHVLLACRNAAKGNDAVQRILAENVSP